MMRFDVLRPRGRDGDGAEADDEGVLKVRRQLLPDPWRRTSQPGSLGANDDGAVDFSHPPL